MPTSQKPRLLHKFTDTPRVKDFDEEARQKEIALRKHERRARAEQNRNEQSVRKR